jgi:hypothetical protein
VHLRGGTVIEGNPRSGVAVLMQPVLRSSGANIIRDNGSAGDPFRAGISTSHHSMEPFAGDTVPANGTVSVRCEATAIVFGDFTGFAPFECANKDKTR